MASTPKKKPGPTQEIGVSGLKVFSGVVSEEFLQKLQGPKAVAVYREMSDNDATVGALLMAIELMCRAVDWECEPTDTSKEAEDAAEFVKSLFEDMSHTYEDFIAEALTMLVFGWSYFETVYKRRVGPLEKDPAKRSKFDDGLIGVRKLAPRSQDTLLRWEMQDDGGIDGMTQLPPQGGAEITLPIEKCLLFRTTTRKNNPEGRSILRTAYRSWYKLRLVQDAEAIGIERELAGLPVVKIPSQYLTSTDPADQALVAVYTKIARDLKFNEQGGLVIPSDVFTNPDGTHSAIPRVDVSLLSTAGSRMIDTTAVAKRYQEDIARSALAEFLMMGSSGAKSTGQAQHGNKTEMFYRACETFLAQIAGVLNRYLIPRVWDLNGMDRALMPEMKPGKIAPPDLDKIGGFVQAIAGAGAPVFPDDPLENHLRELAGLPGRDRSSDEVLQEQAERDAELAEQGAVNEHERGKEQADLDFEREQDGADRDHKRELKTIEHDYRAQARFAPKPKAPVRKGADDDDVDLPFDKYRADQPRAPKGSEDGGQWVVTAQRVGDKDRFVEFARPDGTTTDKIGEVVPLTRAQAERASRKLNDDPDYENVVIGNDVVHGPLEGFAGEGIGDRKANEEAWEEELDRRRRVSGMSAFERYASADGRIISRSIEKYSPDQPRDPKGVPTGGRWITHAGRNLFARTHRPDISLDDIRAQFTAEELAAVDGVADKLAQETETHAPVEKGGHLQPDGTWTPERQALHAKIVDDFFTVEDIARATPAEGEKPKLMFLGGRGGSGKSWFTENPDSPIYGDAKKALYINPDDVQAKLPGYKGWNAALYHVEAGHLTEQIERVARENGLNVVYDATMRQAQTTAQRVQAYKSAGYSVEGHYMHAPPHVSTERAIKRFLGNDMGATGRFVDPGYTYSSTTNETTFDHMTPAFDRWTMFDSSGGTRRLVARKDRRR
jgi:predicted ABC-type ATPase